MERPDTHTARLMPGSTHRSHWLRNACIVAFAVLLAPVLCQAKPLKDFTATYLLEKYNAVVGISTYQLEQKPDQTHFFMRSKVTGLIALFRNDHIEEDSWLKPENGTLQLQRYSYHQHSSGDNQNTELSIQWSKDGSTGTVSGNDQDKPVNINVTAGVRDGLSFQLSLMRNIADNGNIDFSVLNKNELIRYTFKRVGQEQLKIKDQTLDTTIVERQQHDRITRLWLANKYQFTPIKIELLKKGKTDSLMLIDKLILSGKRVL